MLRDHKTPKDKRKSVEAEEIETPTPRLNQHKRHKSLDLSEAKRNDEIAPPKTSWWRNTMAKIDVRRLPLKGLTWGKKKSTSAPPTASIPIPKRIVDAVRPSPPKGKMLPPSISDSDSDYTSIMTSYSESDTSAECTDGGGDVISLLERPDGTFYRSEVEENRKRKLTRIDIPKPTSTAGVKQKLADSAKQEVSEENEEVEESEVYSGSRIGNPGALPSDLPQGTPRDLYNPDVFGSVPSFDGGFTPRLDSSSREIKTRKDTSGRSGFLFQYSSEGEAREDHLEPKEKKENRVGKRKG